MSGLRGNSVPRIKGDALAIPGAIYLCFCGDRSQHPVLRLLQGAPLFLLSSRAAGGRLTLGWSA